MKKKMNEPALVLQHVGARRRRSRRFHLQRHIERLHFPSVPQRLHILLAQLPLHASFLLTNSYSLHFPTLAFFACFLCKTTNNAIVCTDYRRIYSSNFFVIRAVEMRWSSTPCALLLKHCFQNGKKKSCLKWAWRIQNLKQQWRRRLGFFFVLFVFPTVQWSSSLSSSPFSPGKRGRWKEPLEEISNKAKSVSLAPTDGRFWNPRSRRVGNRAQPVIDRPLCVCVCVCLAEHTNR